MEGTISTRKLVQFSWPLSERPQHFELGSLLYCASDLDSDLAGAARAGWWECNLADNALAWSAGVYDLFAIPRGTMVSRDAAIGHYAEASRATLERLRADAIHNRSGFTIDAELTLPEGHRWIRIIAAPDIVDGQVVRLHGLKIALQG